MATKPIINNISSKSTAPTQTITPNSNKLKLNPNPSNSTKPNFVANSTANIANNKMLQLSMLSQAFGTGAMKTEETKESDTDFNNAFGLGSKISNNVNENIKVLLNSVKGCGFEGPNCYNTAMLAYGKEFALYDNSMELINHFVNCFCEDTGNKGNVSDIKGNEPLPAPNDLVVISRESNGSKEHVAVHIANGKYFQKADQNPDSYKELSLAKLTEPYKNNETNDKYTYTHYRMKPGKINPKSEQAQKINNEIKQLEMTFGDCVSKGWKHSEDYKNAHPNAKIKNEMFVPHKETVNSLVNQKKEINAFVQKCDLTLKDQNSKLEESDKKHIEFAKLRAESLLTQLEHVAKSMKNFISESKEMFQNDKKEFKIIRRSSSTFMHMFDAK
ncbi:hypothetical protein SCOR_00960 [Sulfidibacter corallicola]|uniref:Uncharacterized protein n=1 Tax=Sulfidibacter corallicola TaxID=2818388 RepID=A0A8A4TGZ1_SULCO|nr:hypothetical protein [Sulfidibacter corallicola]QTD48903.1 hypothetical protein J3U87_25245 [Sulfidibacter corallicola]